MTTATANKLRRGYTSIPGYSNYAMNRSGEVYNVNTGRDLTRITQAKHWSGVYNLTDDDGNRVSVNTASLFEICFGINRENTIRRNMGI